MVRRWTSQTVIMGSNLIRDIDVCPRYNRSVHVVVLICSKSVGSQDKVVDRRAVKQASPCT
jgi:hypothetical protein